MTSNVFVCSTKPKLVNFNDYLQKRRRNSLKARKSGSHCLLSVKHLENPAIFHMSLSNQTIKYSSNVPSHNVIPVPKIKTQTENERRKADLLLTPTHQEISTSSHEHVTNKRLKPKAKIVSSKNGIDSKKTNQPWLVPFLVKKTLLGKHDTDCDNFTNVKIQPSKNKRVLVKHRISEIENPKLGEFHEVPKLQDLFAKKQNSAFVRRPKRKFRVLSKIQCSSDKTVISRKKDVNSSHNNKPADKDQQTSVFDYASYLSSCLQAAFDRQSNLNVLRSGKSSSKRKQRNEFFEDPGIIPLFSKKLFRPCKTGCGFLRSNMSTKKNMKNEDIYNELFNITQELKGDLQSTNTRSNCQSEHADDCDSGYRSKGDSKDEDGIQQANPTTPFGCYCVRCSAMYYSTCAGGYNNIHTVCPSTESLVNTNPVSSKISFSNCFDEFWDKDNLVSHLDNNWLDNLLDDVNTS